MALSEKLVVNDLLVSIIVPCYKQAQYLDECLQSVFDQTYPSWECIIVNDGSPDNTEEVAKRWIEKDIRFKYLYKKNEGLSSARNYGISRARGKYILPLDADDKISAEYLSLALDQFRIDNRVKVVYCKADKFGGETGKWDLPEYSLKRLLQENMIFCSAIYRKQDWELINGYDVNLKYGIEDWEFWIALLKNGGVVKQLNKVCFFYRVKQNSMVRNIDEDKMQFSLDYISKKHFEFFFREFGSFNKIQSNMENKSKLRSKKYVMDLFLITFFGFTFFGTVDKKNL